MSTSYDTHPLSLVDIPHALRLAENGVVMDTRIATTAAAAGPNGALIASMLPHTSRHTLVARFGDDRAIGQFYITPDGSHAQIVYLAPGMTEDRDDSAWLLVLDAMVQEAGRRGAHTLRAEIREDSSAFVTLRQSGFAVYARQQLWIHDPHLTTLPNTPSLLVVPITEADVLAIHSLYSRTVPSLLQQVGMTPEYNGYVYREEGVVRGYIDVVTGRDGVYLMPYIDHTLPADTARQIILSVAAKVPRSSKRPLTIRVQRHQGWLNLVLESTGFIQAVQQAVMVRHIAAGIQPLSFTPISRKLANGKIPRQTERVPEVCFDVQPIHQIETLVSRTSFGNRVLCDGMPHTHPQRHFLRPEGEVPR